MMGYGSHSANTLFLLKATGLAGKHQRVRMWQKALHGAGAVVDPVVVITHVGVLIRLLIFVLVVSQRCRLPPPSSRWQRVLTV